MQLLNDIHHLTLVTADYGKGRCTRVVTGATNIKEGDVVPLGLVGTRYRDGHSSPAVERVLQPGNMRGIQSDGMVMSGFELGLSPLLGLEQSRQLRPLERGALAADHLLYGLVLSETRSRPRE